MQRRGKRGGDKATHLQRIEELQRKQLSRRLHDGLAQSVAALAMRADLARRTLQKDQAAAETELAKLEDLARHTTGELRFLQFTLAPQALESSGLQQALEDLAAQFDSLHGFTVELDFQADLTGLSPEARRQMFSIATEGLLNAKLHSGVSEATLRLHTPETGMLLLEIEDAGVGFDTVSLLSAEEHGKLGLAIVAERAKLLAAEFHVQSQVGAGCHFRMALPARS